MSAKEKLKVTFEKSATPFGDKTPMLQPEHANNAEQLIIDAKKVEPLLKDIALALIDKANHDLQLIQYEEIRTHRYKLAATKGTSRINKKAEGEYEQNYLDIRDVARSSVRLTSNKKIAALCAVMDWAADYQVELPHGARVVISENRFKNPLISGYSSHKANIAIPIPGETGRWHIAELMLMHDTFEKEIVENKANRFKTDSHGTYEKFRYLKSRAKERPLTRDEAKIFGKLQTIGKSIHLEAREKCKLDEIQSYIKKFERLRKNESWGAMAEYEKKQPSSDSELNMQ